MIKIILYSLLAFATFPLKAQNIVLKNQALQVEWQPSAAGWRLSRLAVKQNRQWTNLSALSGEYTVLYAAEKPDTTPVTLYNEQGKPIVFPEPQYRYVIPVWQEATTPVEMNTAGQAFYSFPTKAWQEKNHLIFTSENDKASLTATWWLDEQFVTDLRVTITLTAKQAGYYSIASPTLATVSKSDFKWAAVPGVFQGNAIENNFIRAFAYGQGIPATPVMVRERTASTLSPLVTAANGITIAVIPDTGIGRNPWAANAKTQSEWQLGLSVMNRKGALTPTIYHPVLGEKGTYLQKGQTTRFSFRYTIQNGDWYLVVKHAANDVYRFPDFLKLKQTTRSLTSRILAMKQYVQDDSTSKWSIEHYKGVPIGAQAYLGGVYGAEKDALKNADYGAMWMLAKMGGDSVLQTTRLPYARNFKRMQQHSDTGFFAGTAAGQYYLYKSKRFTEEWGPYTEPIGLTYYLLMDGGNILLFEPGDTALRNELRRAADKLLAWMAPNGQWQVAYDNATTQPLFTDVQDLRPTFYGLLVAYRLLQDKKYLAAAEKGADWYIANAVEKGHFLGVCGDTRFMADFATGQSVQALLDLYATTGKEKYKTAAVQAARLYTTSIYTHPVPNRQQKGVNGTVRQDWEISQAGLSFEHGGILGSANIRGPILLASHAGLFVRLFALTADSLFLTMARAAALGRDAFVDPATGVASYYWDVMNKGAGPYPHHAWWQIGWITDYLLSEAALRSGNQISFPRGFITPKVGPHQTYGFAPGRVFGTKASLLLKDRLLAVSSPYTDYYCTIDTTTQQLFLILLNNDDESRETTIVVDYTKIKNGTLAKPLAVARIDGKGGRRSLKSDTNTWTLSQSPYDVQVIEIKYRF